MEDIKDRVRQRTDGPGVSVWKMGVCWSMTDRGGNVIPDSFLSARHEQEENGGGGEGGEGSWVER